MIIKFFAPWCSHCKAFAPEFYDFCNQSPIPCGEVNCEEEVELCDRELKQSGYPRIMIYGVDQERIEYEGERLYQPLKEFVDANIQPALIYDKDIDKSRVYFIYYTDSIDKDQGLFKLARGNAQITVMHGQQKFEAVLSPSTKVQFNQSFTPENIMSFTTLYKHGLFPLVRQTIVPDLKYNNRVVAMFAHENGYEPKYLKKLSLDFNRTNIGYCHIDGEEYKQDMIDYKCDHLPCALFLSGDKKYKIELQSESDFIDAVERFNNGKLKPVNNYWKYRIDKVTEKLTVWLVQFSTAQTILMLLGVIISLSIIFLCIVICCIKCCKKQQYSNFEPEKSETEKKVEKVHDNVKLIQQEVKQKVQKKIDDVQAVNAVKEQSKKKREKED